MGTTQQGNFKQLKPDPRNANIHSEYGMGLLENSIRELGYGRSVVISDDGVLIAGNATVEAGAAVGMEEIEIVKTDGKKLIVVQRTDIKSGTPEFHKMAFADNIIAKKNIVFDAEVVEAIVQDYKGVKTWASTILEESTTKAADKDRADLVEMKFILPGNQAAKIKQALKMAREMNKGKEGFDNNNGTALFFIATQFVKAKGKL